MKRLSLRAAVTVIGFAARYLCAAFRIRLLSCCFTNANPSPACPKPRAAPHAFSDIKPAATPTNSRREKFLIPNNLHPLNFLFLTY